MSSSQPQANLKENSNFVSTGDNIKKLESRKIELLSTSKLDKVDTGDLVRKKDALVKIITDIEDLLKKWSELSIEKIQLSTRTDLTPDETDLSKALPIELETKQGEIAQKMLTLSRILDF